MSSFNAHDIAKEYLQRFGRDYRIEDHLAISKFILLMEMHKDAEAVAEVVTMLTSMINEKKHRAWGPLYGETTAVEQLPPFIGDMDDPKQVQDLLDKVVMFSSPYKKAFKTDDILDEIIYGNSPTAKEDRQPISQLKTLTIQQVGRINNLSAEYRHGLCYGAIGSFKFDHKAPLRQSFRPSNPSQFITLAAVRRVKLLEQVSSKTAEAIHHQIRLLSGWRWINSLLTDLVSTPALTGSAVSEQICRSIAEERGREPLAINPVDGYEAAPVFDIESTGFQITAGDYGSQSAIHLDIMAQEPDRSAIANLVLNVREADGSRFAARSSLAVHLNFTAYTATDITVKPFDATETARLMCGMYRPREQQK